MKNFRFLIIILLITSCNTDAIDDDMTFSIFKKQAIRFQASSEDTDNQVITLGSGRLVLKKISLPEKNDYLKASAKIRLVSAGDPWDKSGSFFIIPADSDYLMQNLAKEKTEFPGIKK